MRSPRSVLTRELLLHAVDELVARDADLGRVVERHGPPPLWARRPGFATLARIILEQQISLASAAAAYARLRRAAGGRVTPRRVAAKSERELRGAGLTRQKAAYVRNLAQLVASGGLDLRAVAAADDDTARRALLEVRGVGPWTTDIYLLMALKRPDVWPDGDLALTQAARQVKGMRKLPSADRLRRLAASWRPWRSVAARILWSHYLKRDGYKSPRSLADSGAYAGSVEGG